MLGFFLFYKELRRIERERIFSREFYST